MPTQFTLNQIETFSKKVVAQMDKYGKDWLKPWTEQGLPIRLSNGKHYSGGNVFMLWIAKSENEYKSNTWGTWNQILKLGGRIKEDQAKKYHYVYYNEKKSFKTGAKQDDGSDETKQVWFQKFYHVYNLDQTTLDDPYKKQTDGAKTLPNVEQYIKNTGANIQYKDVKTLGALSGCYYVPSADFIGMVTKDQFNNLRNEDATQLYYATLLHELTHWTSHKNRCDRQYKEKYFENFKSNETYAFEELVAELGASIQCAMLGIQMEPTEHACQYLNIWKDRIKAQPDSIYKASAFANRAVQHIIELQPDMEILSA